jgi:hypothetical protein
MAGKGYHSRVPGEARADRYPRPAAGRKLTVMDAKFEARLVDALLHGLKRRTYERAAAAAELTHTVLAALGPIRRTEHELLAGTRVLNDDRDVLMPVARAMGMGINLYLNNRRVSSASVLDAGHAMKLGGFAEAIVVDLVLRKREVWKGDLTVEGRRVVTASRPLVRTGGRDEHGPIGLIEVFIEEAVMRDQLESVLRGLTTLDGEGSIAHVDRLAGISTFIDDVSRRLQLLALNGNIIASQAGESGRAFRVVCRELSSLAEQAKDAAAESRQITADLGGGAEAELGELRSTAPLAAERVADVDARHARRDLDAGLPAGE